MKLFFLRLAGVLAIIAIMVVSFWASFRLNPHLNSAELGRASAWVVSRLIYALVIGVLAFVVIPKRRGYYPLVVALLYAAFCSWKIYAIAIEDRDSEKLLDSMESLLESGSAETGASAGRYEELVQYLQMQSQMAEHRYAELDALAASAYATFEFAKLPAVTQCDDAVSAWSDVAQFASYVDTKTRAQYEKMPREIEALDLPEDFKRGLLGGMEESSTIAVSTMSELMEALKDLAVLQSDGCQLLVASDWVVDDGLPVFEDPESEDAYRQLVERSIAIEVRMNDAHQRLLSLEQEAEAGIQKGRQRNAGGPGE